MCVSVECVTSTWGVVGCERTLLFSHARMHTKGLRGSCKVSNSAPQKIVMRVRVCVVRGWGRGGGCTIITGVDQPISHKTAFWKKIKKFYKEVNPK